jgi:DNA polymerase-3 subunit alpha
LEKLLLWAAREQNPFAQQQTPIFDEDPDLQEEALPQLPICDPWNPIQQLRYEKEIAGFYISGHPLDNYRTIIENYCNTNLELLQKPEIATKFLSKAAKFVGIVSAVQEGKTKNGKDFGGFPVVGGILPE